MTTSMDSLRERAAKIVDPWAYEVFAKYPDDAENAKLREAWQKQIDKARAKADAILAALRDEESEGNQGHAGMAAIAPGVDRWQPIATFPDDLKESEGWAWLCTEGPNAVPMVGAWDNEDGLFFTFNLWLENARTREGKIGRYEPTHWRRIERPFDAASRADPERSSPHDQDHPSSDHQVWLERFLQDDSGLPGLPPSLPLPPSEGVLELVKRTVRDACEWDEYASPDDPDALVITTSELATVLHNFAAALQAATSPPAALVKLPTAFGEDGRAIGPEYQLAEDDLGSCGVSAQGATGMVCPKCHGHSFAVVDELKPDGHFGPGPDRCCVECKTIVSSLAASRPPAEPPEPLPLGDDVVERIASELDAKARRWRGLMGEVPKDEVAWHRSEAWFLALEYAAGKVRAALSASRATDRGEWRPTHRHVKRGTDYEYLGWGRAQCSESGLLDDEHVAIYRGEDGSLWARRLAEFNDGRFEALAPLNPAPDPAGETL